MAFKEDKIFEYAKPFEKSIFSNRFVVGIEAITGWIRCIGKMHKNTADSIVLQFFHQDLLNKKIGSKKFPGEFSISPKLLSDDFVPLAYNSIRYSEHHPYLANLNVPG
jgi:hypothetical protein